MLLILISVQQTQPAL